MQDDAVDRRQRQFYHWTNSSRPDLQMRTGESRIIYSLTASNAGDGGFVAMYVNFARSQLGAWH